MVPTTTLTTETRASITVASDPKGKLKAWHAYFEKLHRPTDAPDVPKPWLNSPAAAQMKARTATDDFIWPQTMTLEDLRAHLSRGNPKPSPGPDSWEKWALRQVSDDFLLLTLHLCNYMISANYFSPRLKQNFISPLYKRGDLTDPSNYRGIVFANCLYNVVTSWFTQQFQKYIWRRKLLPTLQIATQQGVQPGDLTNFLDQVHTAGIAMGSTFFAIKRDHTKGFDNLHAQGYYDALKFYGVNSAVAAFEQARTKDITLFVKSFDGIGRDKITTTGQTKQGDHPSPIKYTLTMSMLTWWLSLQGPLRANDIPVIKSVNGQNVQHHTPADHLSFKLLSVEAMDDSVMFGTSWTSLAATVKYSEQFQSAYGIQTAWNSDDKTVCFTLGKDLPRSPDTIEFKTETSTHLVPFTDNPKLLRTTLHNQKATSEMIHSIIDAFPIPTDRAWPMAILRRAVSTLLVSRIRPRLHLQPLTPEMADEIDHAISRKVTTALDLTHTRSAILSLPVLCRGFGFPSIQVINGEVAVTMMLRSLNHHLPEIRVMAQISMANWQCRVNGCIPPLESLTEHTAPRAEFRPHACVPTSWIAAVKYLRDADLPVVQTDQSYLYDSSIEHLMTRVQNQTDDIPPRWAANRLRALQTPREANDPVKKWIKSIKTLSSPATLQVKSARDKITDWIMTYPFALSLQLRDKSVFTTVSKRKAHYNELVNAAFKESDDSEIRNTWASDGSHKTIHGRCTSTTAAIVGKANASFRLVGQYGSSLHAERLGLIAALMNTQGRGNETRIITDHLNSVRDVARIRGPHFQDDSWRPQSAHELYRWLLEVIRTTTAGVSHTKAHTDAEDADSRLNDAADREAGLAHHGPTTRIIPALTAWMRPWVAYIPGVGFAQDNWKNILNTSTMEAVYAKQTPGTWRRTDDPVRIKLTSPPEYFYKHSPAGLTAKYQFLMRTGTFLTNERTAKSDSSQDSSCQFCGHKVQDERHLFVDCPHFEKFRDEALRKGIRLHAGALAKKTPDRDLRLREFEECAKQMIRGTPTAPTEYWIGSTPPVPPPLGDLEAKMAHHLAITLTSRIAGSYQRDKAKEREFGRGKKRDGPAVIERHESEEGDPGRGRKRPRE